MRSVSPTATSSPRSRSSTRSRAGSRRCSRSAQRSSCSATAPSLTEVVGVLLVAAGVVLVRGPEGHGDAKALLVVADDGGGDRRLHPRRPQRDPAGGCVQLLPARAARPVPRLPAASSGSRRYAGRSGRCTLTAAAAAFASFVLGLLALRRGAAAPVLAVRTSSIVITTVLARAVLGEEVSRGRLAGSVVVFAGRRAARRLTEAVARPGSESASRRTSSAPGRPTTFR